MAKLHHTWYNCNPFKALQRKLNLGGILNGDREQIIIMHINSFLFVLLHEQPNIVCMYVAIVQA